VLVTDIDLAEVVETVWTSMLGIDLEPTDAAFDGSGRTLTGTVQISGCWEGAVMVRASHAHARLLAATMFGAEPADLDDEEVRDALGETANMVGGNVKGLLAGDGTLSLPTVTEGVDHTVTVPGGALMRELRYRSGQDVVEFRLIAKGAA
jgi:chemotaxis protein CheX